MVYQKDLTTKANNAVFNISLTLSFGQSYKEQYEYRIIKLYVEKMFTNYKSSLRLSNYVLVNNLEEILREMAFHITVKEWKN